VRSAYVGWCHLKRCMKYHIERRFMADLLERQDIRLWSQEYNLYCTAAAAAAIRGQRLHPYIGRSQYPPRCSRLSSLLDMILIKSKQ